jgi:hypothetical protein
MISSARKVGKLSKRFREGAERLIQNSELIGMKSDLRKLFFLIRQPRTKKTPKNAFFFFIFLLLNDTFERKKKKKKKRRSLLCRENNRLHVWSDDESAEKQGRSCFVVGFDRE